MVAPDDKQGNRRLVAYVVADGGFSKEMLTIYLKEKLPDYMLPAVCYRWKACHLTANGKVDKRSAAGCGRATINPRKATWRRRTRAATTAATWQDILEMEQIGIHDDFFELGGHSLLAVRLISAIRKPFRQSYPSAIFSITLRWLCSHIRLFGTGIEWANISHSVPTASKSLVPIKKGT